MAQSGEAAEPKSVAGLSPDEWGTRYRAVRGTYESLTIRLRSLIVDLLADAKIDVIQIEARTKDVESFVQKISLKGSKYNDPLGEITDFVGIRIITYYLEDVFRVGDILTKEFQIDEENSVDKASGFDPDRFGYSSMHYVLTLSPARRKLVEWKQYGKVRIEVQVRTALQHAWSAVSHKLDYKSSTEVPRELRRRLYRLSALFELADDQFSALRDARERVASEYAEDVRGGQLNLPLDEASIGAYVGGILKRDVVKQIVIEAGATVFRPSKGTQARDRRDLLKLLNHVGISSIAELDSYVTSNILTVPTRGTQILDGWSFTGVEDIITLLIMADKRVDDTDYTEIYVPGEPDEFVNVMETWHKLKEQGHKT